MSYHIQDATKISYYSFLKYTPFVPAVKIIDNQWQVDESLLKKRACLVHLVAAAIFVIVSPYSFGSVYSLVYGRTKAIALDLVYGMSKGMVVFHATIRCASLFGMKNIDSYLNGRYISEKYLINKLKELSNEPSSPFFCMENLYNYHFHLSDEEFQDVINNISIDSLCQGLDREIFEKIEKNHFLDRLNSEKKKEFLTTSLKKNRDSIFSLFLVRYIKNQGFQISEETLQLAAQNFDQDNGRYFLKRTKIILGIPDTNKPSI